MDFLTKREPHAIEATILEGVNSKFNDFEDGIQHFSAIQNEEIEVIVTRNLRDYKKSFIPVMTARSLFELLEIKGSHNIKNR